MGSAPRFLLQAGRSGSGLIMGRSPMVDVAVARGDLVAPFPEWVATGRSYYAVWPERRLPFRHGLRVLEWLVEAAEKSTRSAER